MPCQTKVAIHSQNGFVLTLCMSFLPFSPSLVFFHSHSFWLPPASLALWVSSFWYYSRLIKISFPCCFLSFLKTRFSRIWDTLRIMWLTTVNIWNSVMGDEVNAIHSTLIRIHYIALDRGTVQPSICHFLRNGYNRQKKKGKISIHTKLL